MLADDEPTEEDKANELEARIKAPIVWNRLESGIRIEDLQEKRYEEAVTILREHFLNTEVTFKSINIIEDEESVEEFLTNARIQMKDKASLVAVDDETNEAIAILLLRIVDRCAFSRTFSRVKLTYAKCYSTVMKFYNKLEKPVNVHELYDASIYLKIFSLAIKPDFRHRGIGIEMYKCAIASAAASKINVIAGIFTSGHNQELMEKLGFVKHNRIPYSEYIDEDKIVFSDTDERDCCAAFMAAKICENWRERQ